MARPFVPAAGHDLLLPFYDPLWRLMRGNRLRATFIGDADLAPGLQVLDVGCGTGSLAVQIAQSCPGIRIEGLDPDPKALARAAAKAKAAGVDVTWREGFADALPHGDRSLDRVLSSFMFHHLDDETKGGMLREARRVLRPGGQLHLVDFVGSDSGRSWLARLLHSDTALDAAPRGQLEALFAEAGLDAVRELRRGRSLFGPYAHYRADAR